MDEVFFVKNAIGQCQIKAIDAPQVAEIMKKLEAQFVSLQKKQEQSPAKPSK